MGRITVREETRRLLPTEQSAIPLYNAGSTTLVLDRLYPANRGSTTFVILGHDTIGPAKIHPFLLTTA